MMNFRIMLGGLLIVAMCGQFARAADSDSKVQLEAQLGDEAPASIDAQFISNEGISLGLEYNEKYSPSLMTASDYEVVPSRVDLDAGYAWGGDQGFIRVFGGMSYPVAKTLEPSKLRIQELEALRSAHIGLDWKKGGFVGSLVGSVPSSTLSDYSSQNTQATYNLELGWEKNGFGRISIGARNVLNKPVDLTGSQRLESMLDMPEASGRVPYIQYQIDL